MIPRIALEDEDGRVFIAVPDRRSPTLRDETGQFLRGRRSSGWNACLRRIQGETVVITHPGHPQSGTSVPVLHHRPGGPSSSVVVELPDSSTQCMRLSFTNRAAPDPHQAAALPGERLSGLALLELAERIGRWKGGR